MDGIEVTEMVPADAAEAACREHYSAGWQDCEAAHEGSELAGILTGMLIGGLAAFGIVELFFRHHA